MSVLRKEKAKFVQKKITTFKELLSGDVKELPESDLTIQTVDSLIQFEHVELDEDQDDKYNIEPGIFTIVKTNMGLKLEEIEIKTHDLLEDVNNTRLIKNEAEVFFSKLDIYKKYGKDPKRAILLYSQPGMGKTACIAKLSKEFVGEDKGTVVVFWDTSDIESQSVSKFLSVGSIFKAECTRMMLVIEDIGGGNSESHYGHNNKRAEASLLEMLDGASVTFRIPTFIIATTNTPESLIKSIADRPGRFDQMFELPAPSKEERVRLASYIAKRELTKEEVQDLKGKIADGLSIAHISEIIIRAELHDKSFGQVIKEMREHKDRIEKEFQKAKMGMGLQGSKEADD